MITRTMTVTGTLLAASLLSTAAHATLVLDTGTPTGTALTSPQTLDGNDFYAAQFTLAQGGTINSVNAFLTAGVGSAGDTFTLAIYQDNGNGIDRYNTPIFTSQASYGADGWNTLAANMGLGAAAGQYWVALEVGTETGTVSTPDSANGLGVPGGTLTGGTAAANAFAFNAGGGYTTSGALPFGVQVDATTVPLPGSLWLTAAALLGVAGVARRRAA